MDLSSGREYHAIQHQSVQWSLLEWLCLSLPSRINIVAMYIQFAILVLILVLRHNAIHLTKITQILLLAGNDFDRVGIDRNH